MKLADCYSKTNNQDKALVIYQKLVEENDEADTLNILYADLLKRKKEYAKAKEQYLFLYKRFPKKIIYRVYAQYCDSALYYTAISNKKIQIENLKEINSKNSDITPVLYKKRLSFSSNREAIRIKKKTGNTNLPLFDLYIATGKDSVKPDRVALFL